MSPDLKILLLGKHGQLGWELQRSLAPLGHVTPIDFEDVNLSDSAGLRNAVRQLNPHAIVNAAAYTDVDKAETEKQRCFAINATAPAVLAEEAKRCGAALVHYSTDYVFDGEKGSVYFEKDPPRPINVYGASKLEGERAVQSVDGAYVILRTAWVYSRRGSNFLNKVLDWSRHNPVLRIVDDQISNPTWARSLAETTALMLARAGSDLHGWMTAHKGLYHLAAAGQASRFQWAQAILQLDPLRNQQVTRQVVAASTSEFPTPARRPLLSALDSSRFAQVFDLQIPDWREGLRLALSFD